MKGLGGFVKLGLTSIWLLSAATTPTHGQAATDALYFVYNPSEDTAKIIDKATGETAPVALIHPSNTPPSDCMANPWYVVMAKKQTAIDEVVRCDTGAKYAVGPALESSAYPAGAHLLKPLPTPGSTDDPGPSLKP
jgi:hypothetical protein